MFKSSSDLPGWTASEFDRYKDYMGDNWRSPTEIGHNNPPSNGDPGSDLGHRIGFHIPEWVPREKVRAFERHLQEQGLYPDRLAALDQAVYRVRASQEVSAAEYRIYDAVLDTSKGKHRCSLFDMDKLGFLAAIKDRSNASKLVDALEKAQAVTTLRFTEGRVGTPSSRKVLIAPVITAEDRERATTERIFAEMEAAKVAGLAKRAEDARNRYQRKHPQSSSGEEYHENKLLVVDNTTRASSGDDHHENGVSSGKNPFSSGAGYHLLNHIVKPHRDTTQTSSQGTGPDLGGGLSATPELVDTTKTEGSKPCSLQKSCASPRGSEIDLQFEEFWKAFPAGRKQGKGDALDLFRQIVTGKHKKRPRTSAAILIDAVKRYAATKPDPKYTPMPTTWLSGGRWMDDLSGQPKPGSKYDAY